MSLKIKTIVRLRPTLPTEQQDDGIEIDSDTSLSVVNPRDPTQKFSYSFQSVHGPHARQADLWERDVKDVIAHVWEGHAVTVFAYGVTSSGKTHTIQGSKADPGIIPRVVETLFKLREPETDELSMSYSEIYCDEVYDLIAGGVNAPKLPVREDRNGRVVVQNLTQAPIDDVPSFTSIYSKATKSRSVGATNLNHASSRSHAILTLYVARTCGDTTTTGAINLVDLAGSENNKLTGNDSSRMQESAAINKSLAVLGQVVFALNTGASRIPYRDSKLTRILQDCLGGSSVGLLICNLAPGRTFRTDTLNTLNFAARTREVENRPVVNEKDNRPAPKPHFAAVQAAKGTTQVKQSLTINVPAPGVRSVSENGMLHPMSAGVSRPSSRPSSAGPRSNSRTSIAPQATGSHGIRRTSALADVDKRADDRLAKLEAALEAERHARELEQEKLAALERERRLEKALEAERANARELEKAVEEARRKAEAEAYARAQEEMDAKLAKYVEEEVAKRFQDEQRKAGPSPHTSGTLDAPPPAYDLNEEVKKRIDELERKYAIQQYAVENLSASSKKDIARAFLGVARQYFDKGDLETALAFFRRGQAFAPDNAKLQVRIDEIEIAIEKQRQGIVFSPVKRKGTRSTQPLEGRSEAGESHAQTDEEDAVIQYKNNRDALRSGSNANRKKRKQPLNAVEEEADEQGEYIDIEVIGGDDQEAIPKKKKRTVGGGKGKAREIDLEGEENNPHLALNDETARRGRSRANQVMA